MQKMKTNSSAKKRFTRVGKNKSKIKRSKAYRRHLLTKKSAKRKRHLRGIAYVSKQDHKRISLLLAS